MIHFSWNDEDVAYSGNPETIYTFQESEEAVRINATGSTVYVNKCVFLSTTAFKYDSGGAVSYIDSGDLLVEHCLFENCHSENMGGAIYQQNDGNFVLKSCCGIKCYSTSQDDTGQFLYISLSEQSKNRVLDSSVSHSMDSFLLPSYGHTFQMKNGIILFNIANISNNFCRYYAGLYSEPSILKEKGFTMKFSSIADNNSGSTIIWLETNGNFEVFSSNVIHNTDEGETGLIYSSGKMKIKDSCIMENNVTVLFCSNFNSNINNSIIIFNCSLDVNPTGKLTSGFINTSFWDPEEQFLILMKCTQTERFCNASYDSVKGLRYNSTNLFNKNKNNETISKEENEYQNDRKFNYSKALKYLCLLSFLPSEDFNK